MSAIFFYGLFMDESLLRAKSLHPRPIGPAELPEYQIHIANRATLIPNRRSTSYGMLIDLPEEDTIALYSAADVRDYRPDRVNAILLSDRTVHPSLCYKLPADKRGTGSNSEYAERLSSLVLELGLPRNYALEITRLGDA